MESSPACWAKYGDLLAREYENPEYMAAHRLTVDAYAVQHPGRPSAQSIQSVAVHLISLHAVLELSLNQREATALLKVCADKGRFEWLAPPTSMYRMDVLHPLAATNSVAHVEPSVSGLNAPGNLGLRTTSKSVHGLPASADEA
jgi:hypothetical protein